MRLNWPYLPALEHIFAQSKSTGFPRVLAVSVDGKKKGRGCCENLGDLLEKLK
jgi:hypothetical protein